MQRSLERTLLSEGSQSEKATKYTIPTLRRSEKGDCGVHGGDGGEWVGAVNPLCMMSSWWTHIVFMGPTPEWAMLEMTAIVSSGVWMITVPQARFMM